MEYYVLPIVQIRCFTIYKLQSTIESNGWYDIGVTQPITLSERLALQQPKNISEPVFITDRIYEI